MTLRRWTVLLLLAGCAAAPDGSRLCDHSPDEGERYVPDPEPPLAREYWRVFELADGSAAYMMPRPDATGLTYGLCDGDDPELADLFDRNGLCAEIGDPVAINAMPVDDALAIAHALHQRLDFEAVVYDDGTAAVVPSPVFEDALEACRGPGAGVAELADYCALQESRVGPDGTCNDLGVLVDEAGAPALAEALDALYGIAG